MAVHLKVDDDELDVDELDVEWDEGPSRYKGDIPKDGTILNGQVTKMWWTYSGDNTPMLKLLFVADETAGEYEGLPAWENMVLKPSAAFKYGPFLKHFGLTLKDVKTKTYVSEDDDSQGAPIERIAKFSPGGDSAFCAIEVVREKYEGNWNAHVGAWLEYDPDRAPGDDDDEDEEAPARPTRGARAKASGAGAKTSATTRGGRRKAAEPEEEAEEEEAEAEEEEAEEEAPPARGRKAAPARKPAASTRKAPARKPAARGRKGSSDDPPF